MKPLPHPALPLAALAFCLALSLAPAPAAHACPGCKNAYTAGGDAQTDPATAALAQQRIRTGQGYNLSIYLMMPAPFLLVAALGYFLLRHVGRADRAMLQQQQARQLPA
jgi:hypothetical protein